ncbi:MAG: FAD-dependent oxidoreductase [Sphingomonadaceae bacterium]|nr:FAD-dependent oxidoreductase [Sphingomonadaceae bacterium]
MDRVDVAVVGGGAAGIAAARTVAAAGRSVLLLEAGQRLGGRAHSVTIDGAALDLGCGWLHSADRNPLVGEAAKADFAIDRTRSAWREQYRELGFAKTRQREAQAAFAAFSDRLRDAPPATDIAADALLPGCIWNGWIDALSGYINGAPSRDVSVADYLAYDDAATDANWRLPAGYGTLIATLGSGLPARLGCAVTAIDGEGMMLTLTTACGPLGAQAAIITVPTSVLAAGAIRFGRGLDDHLDAAARLPLGLADKLFLAGPTVAVLEADSHLIGSPWRTNTGSYYLRPFGHPVIECFLAGDCARVLEAAGEGAAAAFAIDELAALLGSDFARGLRPVAASAWGRDPLARGSYSHALPGHADARATLAAPALDGRLRFAGEACSPTDFSTAHGAWASGIAAAQAVLALFPSS